MRSAVAAILGRPRAVLSVMAAALVGGLLAYTSIPKDANPDIDVPVFYISVTQQGISPEDAERLLVRPLETKLRSLTGLKDITGIASEGHAGVVLEFNIEFDKDKALADVRAKVDEARADFPSEADEPRITETNFSLVPTIVVALSGDAPERTTYQTARRLKDEIEGIATVLEARLTGQREELLEVVIDQARLESYALAPEDVLTTVSRNNRLVPAGSIDTGGSRFNVKLPGVFETPTDVLRLPIKVSGDGVVTVGDVAEVRRTFKDATSYFRINGKPAIGIEVVKRKGTNIIENNIAVRRVVAEASKDWPETIRVNFLLDQSRFINEVVGSLEANVITAISLVMIVTLAALGARSAGLVGLAIPVSFLIGFLLLALAGFTVNVMVLFSLVVTTGMVVDGAMVVVEHADRRVADGAGRREAYFESAQLMFWPVASGTLTTLAAFLPMLLWPGVAGEFMRYLPMMTVFVLSASLLTALIFIPALGMLLGRRTVRDDEIEVARTLESGDVAAARKLPGVTGAYARLLTVAIRRPAITVALVGAIVAGGFVAFASNPTGVEFFVEEEPEQAVVLVSARGNLSAAQQRDLMIEVEREIMQIKGVSTVMTLSGKTPGAPQVGEVQDAPADTIGRLTLEFETFDKRRDHRQIFAEIRARTAPIAGLRVEVRKMEGGPPTGKAVRLQVSSETYADVEAATARITRHMETAVTGLIDIEDTRPLPGIEWQVTVDREEAGRFGTDVAGIGTMVQLVTSGVLVGKYRPNDAEDEIDIRVRLPEAERSLDRLDGLTVLTRQGLVPVGNLVERTAKPQVSSITRTNGRYAMTSKANVAPGVLSDDKVSELDGWLKTQTWPEGVSFRFRGAEEDQKESGAFLQRAMLASLFLMFMILVIQFNSIGQTLLTLTTVIMSVSGVLIGMLIFDQRFSIIMTGIGVLALAGIVVNNAIILIDAYNERIRQGFEVERAALVTAVERLRPVFLTTGTTVIALVPNALQFNIDYAERVTVIGGVTSNWWVQLSTAIICGLSFATLLTLVFVPAMLAAPTVWGRAIRRLRDRWRGGPPAPANEAQRRPRPAPVPVREAAE